MILFVYDRCDYLKELQLDPHPHHQQDYLFNLFDPFAMALVECRAVRIHQIMICRRNDEHHQEKFFSPFKNGELEIVTDLEPFGMKDIADIVLHYFGITLPGATYKRWNEHGCIGVDYMMRQIFNIVKNLKCNGDIVANEQEWYEQMLKFAFSK